MRFARGETPTSTSGWSTARCRRAACIVTATCAGALPPLSPSWPRSHRSRQCRFAGRRLGSRSRAAADAAGAIKTVGAVHAGTAREVRDEGDVIAKRNVEFSTQVRMARHSDDEMPGFAIADSGIARKRDDAFLIGLDNCGSDREVFPLNFAAALAFAAQDFVVGLSDGDDQRRFCPGAVPAL